MALQLEDDVPDFPRGSYLLPSIIIVSLQSFAAIQILSIIYLVDYIGNQRESDLFIFLIAGGGSSLNRKERDEIRAEVDAEFEAEERELKKRKKKRMPKESLAMEDELGSLFGDGITGKLPRYANKITLKVSCLNFSFWEANKKRTLLVILSFAISEYIYKHMFV